MGAIRNSDQESHELLDKLRDRILAPQEDVDLDGDEDNEPIFLDRKNYPEVDEEWLAYIEEKWEPWAEKHRNPEISRMRSSILGVSGSNDSSLLRRE